MAGYSGTPLAKKLGIRERANIVAVAAPKDYLELLQPLPPRVSFSAKVDRSTDIVHIFTASRSALSTALAKFRKLIDPRAMIWVSWPKKASKVPTDITEDVIREVALPLGFVDVKVCAVDQTWSGLKLVVRKELR